MTTYEIFNEYKKFTLNTYWFNMLDFWSAGNFHKGITYDPDTGKLRFAPKEKKGKTRAVTLKDGSYEEFKKIIKECKIIGYTPHADLDIINNSPAVGDYNVEYKNIKPNNIKDDLRMEYICRIAEVYKLTPPEIKELISTIQLAFQFHNLTCNDVVMKNGKIVCIKNLKYDRNNKKFIVAKKNKTHSEKVSVAKDNFIPFLEKYIKEVSQRSAIKSECICTD